MLFQLWRAGAYGPFFQRVCAAIWLFCIQLAIVSLWHLGITHSLGSLRWLAQRNQGIEVARCFWLSRCKSKHLLTYTKIVENMYNSVWNLFFSRSLVEGTQTILKSDMLMFFLLLHQFFHLICFFMFLIYKSENEIGLFAKFICHQGTIMLPTEYRAVRILILLFRINTNIFF